MSNQNPLYEITTRMDKDDYRKFSYLTVFRKKGRTILLIIVLAAAGAGLTMMMDGTFSLLKFLFIWLILIPTAFAAIFVRTEYKAMNWMNLVRAGAASARQTLVFYEDYLIAKDDTNNSSKIKYDKLYQVLETKDYYFIHVSASSASMLRKRDIDDEDQAGFQKFLKVKLGERYKKLAN